MFSHISKSETRSAFGFLQYCVSAQIYLTQQEMQITKRHRLNRRIEIFHDPIRDELNANAESAHEKAVARGLFVTTARDASAVCAAEIRAIFLTVRALRAFNITFDDLLRGITIKHYSLRAIGEIEQVLIDCIDHINRWLQSARSYADQAEDIFEPGTNDDATVPPNQWPRNWRR
jgi:hypothetical protein